MTRTPEERDRLLGTVHAAQLVAGVLSARHRGDPQDAAILMSEASPQDLTSGAMLLAELSLTLYARESGQDVQTAISSLCVDLEKAVGAA